MKFVHWLWVFLVGIMCIAEGRAQVSLEEALDGEGLVWTTGPETGWEGRLTPLASDSVDAAGPTLTSDPWGQRAWLRTKVTGPGVLRFRWIADGEQPAELLEFYVGGIRIAPTSFVVEDHWNECALALGEGEHDLRWKAHRRFYVGELPIGVLLDRVNFSAGATLDVGREIEGAAMVVLIGPAESLWTEQSETHHDGVSAAMTAGSLAESQKVTLSALFPGTGSLSFWSKTAGGETDLLMFTIGEEPSVTWTGDREWVETSVDLPKPAWGVWQYTKGEGRAWVDEVRFEPSWEGALAEALDIEPGEGIHAVAGNGTASESATESHDGEDAVILASSDDLASPEVSVGVVGPGVLRYWERRSGTVYARHGFDQAADTINRALSKRYDLSEDAPAWQETEIVVGPGPTSLRWTGTTTPGGAWVLDEMNWRPAISTAEALDTDLEITSSGWVGLDALAADDGEDYATNLALPEPGDSAWVQVEVTGPTWVGYSWSSVLSNLVCEVDGKVVATFGERGYHDGWERLRLYVGPGQHVIRWVLQGDEYYQYNDFGEARLDGITLEPAQGELALMDALDLVDPGAVLVTEEPSPFAQSLVSHEGGAAIQIDPLQTLTLCLGRQGTLNWWERDDSITDPEHRLAWIHHERMITSPDQLIRFDRSASHRWLDRMRFRPTISIDEVLGTGLSFTSGEGEAVRGYASDDRPVVVLPIPLIAEPSFSHKEVSYFGGWLETEVEGPGQLHYEAEAYGRRDEWAGSNFVATGLRLFIDGEEVHLQTSPFPRSHVQSIAPGRHTVRWEYTTFGDRVFSLDGAAISNIEMISDLPLSDILDLEEGYHSHLASTEPFSVDSVGGEEGKGIYWSQLLESDPYIDITSPGYGDVQRLLTFRSQGSNSPYAGSLQGGSVFYSLPSQLYTEGGWTYHLVRTPVSSVIDGVRIHQFGGSAETRLASFHVSEPIDENEALETDLPLTKSRFGAQGYRGVLSPTGDFVALTSPSHAWIETEIEGPGRLQFRMLSGRSGQRLLVNRKEVLRFPRSPQWEVYELELLEGTNTVRWDCPSQSEGTGVLDRLVWTPESEVTVGPLDWEGDGIVGLAGGWEEVADPLRVNGSYLNIEPSSTPRSTSPTIRVRVDGAGILRFWGAGKGTVQLKNEGSLYHSNEFPFASQVAGVGQWHVMPTFEETASIDITFAIDEETGALLDALSWTPQISLAEGLDVDGDAVSTGGDGLWWGAAFGGKDDGEDAIFGRVVARQVATLQAPMEGPGVFSFWWKTVDAVPRPEIKIDGVVVTVPAPSSAWKKVEFHLGDGEHLLEWRLQGDYSRFGFLWLDAFQWAPEDHPLAMLPVGAVASSPQGVSLGTDGALEIELEAHEAGYLAFYLQGAGLHRFSAASLLASSLSVSGGSLYSSIELDASLKEVVYQLGADEELRLNWSPSLGEQPTAMRLSAPTVDEEEDVEAVPTLEDWFGVEGVTTGEMEGWRVAPYPDAPYIHANSPGAGSQTRWIEIPVVGARSVSFQWRGYSEDTKLLVDGSPLTTLSSTGDWKTIWLELTDETNSIRIESILRPNASMAGLPSLRSFQTLPGASLTEALDWNDFPIAFEGGGWESLMDDAYGGGDALSWQGLPGKRSHGAFTLWLPAGSLTFRSLVDVGGVLDVQLNDSSSDRLYLQPSPWAEQHFVVPPGGGEIRFSFTAWIDHEPSSRILLDQFSFQPLLAPSEIEQVSELELISTGDGPWLGVSSPIGFQDPNYLRSPNLDPGETASLEASVTGPGLLEFAWRMTRYRSYQPRFRVWLDDQLLLENYSSSSWRWLQAAVPEGEHVLRWEYDRPSSGEARVFLDNIRFLQGNPSVLGEAMDSDLTWSGGGAHRWNRVTDVSFDGEDSLEIPVGSGAMLDVRTGLAERSVASWWERQEYPETASLRLFSFGDATIVETAADGWERKAVVLPANTEGMSWYAPEAQGSDPPNARVWMDQFDLQAVEQVSLGEALDEPGLVWRTSPDASWSGEAHPVAPDGVDQARSGLGTLDQPSWLETTLTGPAELHFTWQASSIAEVLINDVSIDAHGSSGTGGAKDVVLFLTPGAHTIRWVCQHGTVDLDQVRVVPPGQGLSKALEWYPASSAAILVSDRGGLRKVLQADGDEVIEVGERSELSLRWHSPSGGMFGVVARLLEPAVADGRGPDVSVQHGNTRRVIPNGSRAWHRLGVSITSAALVTEVSVNRGFVGTEGKVQLSRLRWFPSESGTIADALDSSLVFVSSPESRWMYERSWESGSDLDIASSTNGYPVGNSWLETVVEGPGQLGFWSRGHVAWTVNDIPFTTLSRYSNNGPSPTDWRYSEVAVPPGTYTFRWASHATNAALNQVHFVQGAGLPPFETWALLYDLEGAAALPLADPNNDGLLNQAAWAFGIAPTGGRDAADESRLPTVGVTSTLLGDCLEMEYYRRRDAAEDYRPQFGDTPAGPWSALHDEVHVEDLGNGWQRVRVRDRVPVSGPGGRFGQVEIINGE